MRLSTVDGRRQSAAVLSYRWWVDRASDRPMWQQIADQVRGHVRRGSLRRGDVLSTGRICNHTGVSRGTVNYAMQRLALDGVVAIRNRVGAEVLGEPDLVRLGPEDLVVVSGPTEVRRADGSTAQYPSGTTLIASRRA